MVRSARRRGIENHTIDYGVGGGGKDGEDRRLIWNSPGYSFLPLSLGGRRGDGWGEGEESFLT